MTTSIRPVGHHLVVEPIELPKTTKGGIIIKHEGTMWDKLESAGRMIGTILAIGPQCWKAHAAAIDGTVLATPESLQPWAEVGDLIMYSRHAGKFMFDPMFKEQEHSEFGLGPVKLKEVYVINDDDVIAVLPPQADWKLDLLDIVG